MKTVTYDEALFQLVPKEPTNIMLNTGLHAIPSLIGGYSSWSLMERCYKAMLADAPSPPSGQWVPAATMESVREALEKLGKQFRFYEEEHLKKNSPVKAITNSNMAVIAEAALALLADVKKEGV